MTDFSHLMSWLLLFMLFVDAQWTSTVLNPEGNPPLSEMILNYNTGTTATVVLQLSNPRVSLADGIQNEETILPGSCTSTSPNLYGWNYWANKLLPPGTVGSPSGTRIVLNLFTLPGFSPTATETVTCGIGLASSRTGRSYGGQISPGDIYAQFTIVSVTTNIIIRVVDPVAKTSSPLPFPTKPLDNPAALTEGGVREFGIIFDILYFGDVFNASLVPAIMNSTKCSSVDPVACETYMSYVKSNYFLDSVNDPQRIQIRVSRKITRFFQATRDLFFSLSLPSGRSYGLKQFPANIFNGPDNSFTVASYTGDQAPIFLETVGSGATRRAATTMVMTENCIRGRNWTRACPRLFWASVGERLRATPSVLIMFAATELCFVDIVETSFESPSFGFLTKFVTGRFTTSTLTGLSSPATANYDIYINVTALPEYNIDSVETIRFTIPFSCLTSKEPPENILEIVVVPSPGDLVGHVRNLTVNDVWNGGVEFEFHLGGERWLDNVTDETYRFATGALYDKNLQQFVTVAGQEGWEKWRACVLPPGSTTFKLVNGLVNRSIVVLKFQACPMYVNGADEIITFSFPPILTPTGLPYANVSNMTFGVKFFNGTFAIQQLSANYSIDDLDKIYFVMNLQGGEVFASDKSACVAAILAAWPSNKPSGPLDANGWSNPQIRSAVMLTSGVQYSKTPYGTLAVATFLFSKPAEYRTRAGEVINMTHLPGECLASGNSIFPNQTYEIKIIPRRMTISMAITNLSAPVLGSVGGAGSVLNGSTMREGGFFVILSAVNDTFDTSNPSLAETINAAFTTTSVQPRGFTAFQSTFLSNATTSVNDTTVVIYFNQAISYVVNSPEFIRIRVDASWTASKQQPFGADLLNFTVVPSAGYITVDSENGWFGANRNVTEIDVREGKLFFTFRLLGDQWIQERNPYVQIFRSAEDTATGFINLVEQLLPTEKFFNFVSDGPFQYFTLRLQGSNKYDIARDEVVYISFSSATVSSRIAPIVTLENKLVNCAATRFLNIPGSFPFCIKAASARMIVSGRKENLDETTIRRGGTQLYVTLFGETWISQNLSACLRTGVGFVNPGTKARFEAIALPLDGSSIKVVNNDTISIELVKCTSYTLQGLGVDSLQISVSNQCVESNISVWPPLEIMPIRQTPGELNLFSLDPPIVTEETIRTRNVTLNISIDGDAWNSEVQVHSACNSTNCDPSLCKNTSYLFSRDCFDSASIDGGSLQLSCIGSRSESCVEFSSHDLGGGGCESNATGYHSLVCGTCNMMLGIDLAPIYYKLLCGNDTKVQTGALAYHCDSKCDVCSVNVPFSAQTCLDARPLAPSLGAFWLPLLRRRCTTYRATRFSVPGCSANSVGSVVEEYERATMTCEFYPRQQNVMMVACPTEPSQRLYSLLLNGFSSSASPIAEPSGFKVRLPEILYNTSSAPGLKAADQVATTVNPFIAISPSFVTIIFSPTLSYDIKETEIISLTVADPWFVRSGTVPNPFIVYFTISSAPTVLIVYYQPITGQYSPTVVSDSIKSALSILSPDGINVTLDSRLGSFFVLHLFFDLKPSELDSRTNLQLTDLLLSMTPLFLQKQLNIECLNKLDPSGVCVTNAIGRINATNATALAADPPPTIFFVAGFAFVVGLVVVDYLYMRNSQAALPGGNRPVQIVRSKDKAKVNVNLGEKDYQVRPTTLRQYYKSHKKRGGLRGLVSDETREDPFDFEKEQQALRERNVINVGTIRHQQLQDQEQMADVVRHAEAVEARRRLRGHKQPQRIVDDLMDTF